MNQVFRNTDPAADILQRAQALAAGGDRLGAIALAAGQLGALTSPEIEKALIGWRFDAFSELRPSSPAVPWPAPYEDPFPAVTGLAETRALDVDTLGGAIAHHGSLCVRGFLSRDEAESLRKGIETAVLARNAYYDGTATDADSAWYTPFDWGKYSARGDSRAWTEAQGGIWTVDSPRMMQRLIDLFESRGVIDLIADYLGERPALSMGKSLLRRSDQKPERATGHGWHQDGAFLGNVRSVNVWIALSDCGVDAPGLDVVARRLPYVIQTGSHGICYDWTVGGEMVDMLVKGGAPIVSPVFEPGDALMFDHLMLHRTGAPEMQTKPRWAIESWFFAPSAFPMDQGPFVI